MNDKAVALLEQYDIEVLHTRKGRGAYLCETNRGVLIFKEYAGTEARLKLQNCLQQHILAQGVVKTDEFILTKEGELFVKDKDGVRYILKTYYEGRECNIYEKEECLTAIQLLAQLHNSMEDVPNCDVMQYSIMPDATLAEYEKHTRELMRIRNYLRKKKQKQLFERKLYSVMDDYITQANLVTDSWRKYITDLGLTEQGSTYYHGNYQYHNIINYENHWYIVNFEKSQQGSQMKDVYLLLRKLLEKSEWQIALGKELLEAYRQYRSLSARDSIDLYYRLAYPEKFWKIVNYYYNASKAWIPEKNMEKLDKLLMQEESRQMFLDSVFSPECL